MKKSFFEWFLFAMLMIILGTMLMFLLASCDILKSRKEAKSDTTSLHKTSDSTSKNSDSTHTSKTSINSQENFDWWRTVLQYAKDTSHTSVNVYPQPATVIYEGGKGTKDIQYTNSDSTRLNSFMNQFNSKMDSLNSKVEESTKDKHSETKGLGLMTLILLGVGFLVANHFLGFVTSKYSIIKKVIP